MKQLLFLLLSFSLTSGLHAQQKNIRKQLLSTLHHPTTSTAKISRANMVSEWYNYPNTINELVGDINAYRFLLFPDSTVLVSDGSSMVSPLIHSVGQVFDPTDPGFDALNVALSRYVPYTLDSISFGYRYWRFQNSAPDTLIVQIYTDNYITFESDPGWTSGASYATVEYDYTKNLGKFSVIIDTILLTDADTISDDIALISIPVNLSISEGKKVAATITYFPGNPYATGDTLDPEVNAVTKINAIELYDYGTDYISPHFYNNELDAVTSIRYNNDANGWNDYYMPGTAFGDEFYHFDISWRITYDQTALGLHSSKVTMRSTTFPNPTADLLTVEMNSDENEKIFISVYNLIGEEVFSKSMEIKQGRNSVELHLPQNTPEGLYRLNIKTGKSQLNTSVVYQR